MKILSTILLFLVCTVNAFSGGYSSWWQQTPEGNMIAHERAINGYTTGIVCKNANVKGGYQGHVIPNLKEWYFYKRHFIGQYRDSSQAYFFIFDESNCQKEIFTRQEEFKTQLKKKKLKPVIWTRWYNKNYGVIFTDGHLGDKLFCAYVQMPLIVLFSLFFTIVLFRTKFNITKPINKLNLVLAGILVLRIILDLFPNSI